MKKLLLILLCLPFITFSQEWVDKMQNPNNNFYEIQGDFEEYWRSIRLRRAISLRNQRGSGLAPSSSRKPPPAPPDHWANKCCKCKRVTRDQSARCSFCERQGCHNCMKLMVCCQKWKCKQCTCFC